MTFREFMRVNVRYHLPSVYRDLVSDWKAVNDWADERYLLDKIGNQHVEAINYLSQHPFRNYAGREIFTNQKGRFVPFASFWQKYEEKYGDENLENKNDAINMLVGEKVFDAIAGDIKEPNTVNKVLDHEFTTWNMLSQSTRTMTKYNKQDVLHCVVSGFGE